MRGNFHFLCVPGITTPIGSKRRSSDRVDVQSGSLSQAKVLRARAQVQLNPPLVSIWCGARDELGRSCVVLPFGLGLKAASKGQGQPPGSPFHIRTRKNRTFRTHARRKCTSHFSSRHPHEYIIAGEDVRFVCVTTTPEIFLARCWSPSDDTALTTTAAVTRRACVNFTSNKRKM